MKSRICKIFLSILFYYVLRKHSKEFKYGYEIWSYEDFSYKNWYIYTNDQYNLYGVYYKSRRIISNVKKIRKIVEYLKKTNKIGEN